MWMPPNTLNKMSKYNNTIKAAFLLHFFRGQIISMPYLKIFHSYSYLVTTSVSSTLENLQIYQKIRNSLVEFSYTFNQFFQDIAGTHSTTIANKHIIYNLTAVSTYLDSTVSCQLLSGLVGRWDLPIQKWPYSKFY